MTDNNIIIEVAKLDGFDYTGVYLTKHGRSASPDQFLYLISRDAIIPVIEKVLTTNEQWTMFSFYLEQETGFTKMVLGLYSSSIMKMSLTATARQLSTALLKATGNWKE